jgi:competence protein ComEA
MPVTPTLALGFALAAAMASASAAVNVNTAQQSELQSTRGLDKFKAKQIIEYRHQHGPYRSLDDLAKVVGPETAGKIAQQVAFSGDPYVPPGKAAAAEKKAKK